MERLVPVPFVGHVPVEIKDGASPLGDAMDSQINAWVDDAFGIEYLKDPARCPSQFLEDFGYQIAAGIRAGDDERTKRAKIVNASASNAARGLWEESVKPAIEARSGGTAQIVGALGTDDFIIPGIGDEPESYLWSVIGGVDEADEFGIRIVSGGGEIEYEVDVIGIDEDQMLICGAPCEASLPFTIGGVDEDDDFGARILGTGIEIETATADAIEPTITGTILIDVGNTYMTESQVAEMVKDLFDLVPAYFLVYLGYMDGEVFVPYSNGVIGG